MDITKTATLTWNAPTTRTDGTALKGVVTYIIELVDANNAVKQYTATTPTKTFNFEQEGVKPGTYTLFVRAQEDYNGTGKVSARSNGLPLVLELVAEPNPPTNLKVI